MSITKRENGTEFFEINGIYVELIENYIEITDIEDVHIPKKSWPEIVKYIESKL